MSDPEPPRNCCKNCCSMFYHDWTGICRCAPNIRSVDVIHKTDGSEDIKIIDIPASFSPPIGMLPKGSTDKSFLLVKAAVVAWKLLVLGVEIYTIAIDFAEYTDVFRLGYLTIWSYLFATVYSLLSLANTISPISTVPLAEPSSVQESTGSASVQIVISTKADVQSSSNYDEYKVSKRTLITWLFFTLAAIAQITVTVLFWGLVYTSGTPSLFSVLAHGVIFVLVWVDGLVINRIPVRLRHWLELCLPMFVAYVIWTILQSPLVFEIDNPFVNDDRIYPVLDWDEKPLFSLGMVSGLVLVFTPIAHTVLWGLSLAGRRYIDVDAAADDNKNEGDEELHEMGKKASVD